MTTNKISFVYFMLSGNFPESDLYFTPATYNITKLMTYIFIVNTTADLSALILKQKTSPSLSVSAIGKMLPLRFNSGLWSCTIAGLSVGKNRFRQNDIAMFCPYFGECKPGELLCQKCFFSSICFWQTDIAMFSQILLLAVQYV